MGKAMSTLVRPKLKTQEDYIRQREKSKNDFEQFAEKRNRLTYINNGKEKKRM